MTEENHHTDADIILRHKAGEPVTLKDVPVAVMQALYHEITGKTESLSKNYNKSFVITEDTIRQLFFKLEQTLEQFDTQASDVKNVIRHREDDTVRYSSKERFFQYDKSRTAPIAGIDIELSFLLAVPSVKKLHQYKIEIGLSSSSMKGDETDRSLFGKLRFDPPPIFVKVSFVDYVVARTFVSAFDEWVKGIDAMEVPSYFKNIDGVSYEIDALAPVVLGASSLALISALFFRFGTDHSANAIWVWASLAFGAYFVFRGLGSIIANYFVGHCEIYGEFPLILLNKGDERNQQNLKDNIKSRPIKMVLAGTTYVGIAAFNVGSTAILKWLGF